MKILYVTTIDRTMCFFKDHIKMLLGEGNTIEVACNCTVSSVLDFCRELNLKIHNIPFSRSPLNKDNVKAYQILKKLVTSEKFEIIHTHTPVASVCTRVACRTLRKDGVKVFYTAHGFHFYKGAPIKNWLIYYPAEWLCAHWTDVLITINKEDYALAQKKMKAKKVVYVPGVGIDLSRFGFSLMDKDSKRAELKIPEDTIIILSVGELSIRKNHTVVLSALYKLKNEFKRSNVMYLICGKGDQQKHLEKQIKELDLEDMVRLLGYRTDIGQLCELADIFVLPSLQEGLPAALMEAMACGRSCVASDIRGNADLIADGQGGFLCDPHDTSGFAQAFDTLISDKALRMAMGRENKKRIKAYAIEGVVNGIKDEYTHDGYIHMSKTINNIEMRRRLGIPVDAVVLLSVGELNVNKNHSTVIKAIAGLNLYYVIAGEGSKKKDLQCLAVQVGMADRVKILGFRSDVIDLYAAADAFVFPSYREGLSVSLMEAMVSGLPGVVSRIRGNIDLIDENGGVLFDPFSVKDCRNSIVRFLATGRESCAEYNRRKVEMFSTERIIVELKDIYLAAEKSIS